MKKTLAILLSLAMVFCMIPMYTGVAYAAAETLTADMVTVSGTTSFSYDGLPHAPATVTVSKGNLGTDYAISYAGKERVGTETDYTKAYASSTKPTNAGKYYVVVTPVSGSNLISGSAVTKGSFEIVPQSITDTTKISILPEDVAYTGSSAAPSVIVKNLGITPNRTLTKDADYKVEVIDAAILVGSTSNIKVTGLGNYSGVENTSFIIKKADIKGATIYATDLSNQSQHMTIATDKTVTLTDKGKERLHILINGQDIFSSSGVKAEFANDLEVKITASSVTNPSTITVKLTVKSGAKNLTLSSGTSVEKTLNLYTDINNCTFYKSSSAVSSISLTYNGVTQKPDITVKSGSTTLVEGTNYEVNYSDNTKDVGTAYMYITGLSGYYGTKTLPIVISPRTISSTGVTCTLPSSIVAGENPDSSFVITDSVTGAVQTLVQNRDYTIEYRKTNSSGDKISGEEIKTLYKDTTASQTIYYTLKGIGNYLNTESKNIKTGTFTVVPGKYKLASAALGTTTQFIYTGAKQVPILTVYDPAYDAGNKILSSNYYTVKYYHYVKGVKTVVETPKDADVYYVVVTGKNGYVGELDAGSFEIKAFNWDENTVNITALKNGSNFIVTMIGYKDATSITFVQGTDFNVQDITTAYQSQVRITPLGNNLVYSSTSYKDIYYTTTSTTVTKFTVTPLSPTTTSVGYLAAGYTPTYTVKAGDKALTKGTDYSIKYYSEYTTSKKTEATAPLVTPGKYKVVITGLGGYSTLNEYTTDFTISANNISTYTVTLKEPTVKATGVAQTPTISSVMSGTNALTAGTDYEVSYKNAAGTVITASQIINPGKYTVVVTGKGNYTGSASAVFTIYGDPQYITVTNVSYSKYRGSDGFDLGAVCATSTLKYESSDEEVVQVTQSGIAYMAGKVGTATITITAPATSKLEQAQKTITIVSKPYKGTVKSVSSSAKGKIKAVVKKQSGCTGYQLCVSRSSSFKAGNRIFATITNNAAYTASQSKTISGLTSGKTYYVKVRAIYSVDGVTKYGNWSTVKTVKVK